MIGYAARRLLQTIPTIIVMSMVIFGIMQLIPGGPMAARSLYEEGMSAGTDAFVRSRREAPVPSP